MILIGIIAILKIISFENSHQSKENLDLNDSENRQVSSLSPQFSSPPTLGLALKCRFDAAKLADSLQKAGGPGPLKL